MSVSTKKSIVVVGGGAAGVAAASLLEKAVAGLSGYEVILVTGREYFFHLIAGLRANVSDAEIAEQIAVNYDKLFKNQTLSKIVLKKATEIKSDRVVLEDGSEIPFAYCVVATGKQWMAPADVPNKRAAAIEQMKSYRDKVAAAHNIFIIGGGAVGVEMAGEISGSHPGKKVTIIHSQDKLVNDTYNDKFRNGLQKQLEDLGVTLLLGDRLNGEYDFVTGPLDLRTQKGKTLTGVDLVIQATGGSVNSSPLQKLVSTDISSAGVKVRPTLQLNGHDNVFVIGDLADLHEQKQAAKAPGHAAVASKNIVSLIKGQALTNYKKPGEMAVINIGKTGGMGYVELPMLGGTVLGAWFAKAIKGKGLFISQTRASLGY